MGYTLKVLGFMFSILFMVACDYGKCELINERIKKGGGFKFKYELCEGDSRSLGFVYNGELRQERMIKLDQFIDVLSVDLIPLFKEGVDTINVYFYTNDSVGDPFYSSWVCKPSPIQLKKDWKSKASYFIKKSAVYDFSTEEVVLIEDIMKSLCRLIIEHKNPNLKLLRSDVDFYRMIESLTVDYQHAPIKSRSKSMLKGIILALEDTTKHSDNTLKFRLDSLHRLLPENVEELNVSEWE